jgi:hypothetical protein
MMYLPHCPLLLLTAKKNMTIAKRQCTYSYLLLVTLTVFVFPIFNCRANMFPVSTVKILLLA